MDFDWDRKKRLENIETHGVDFLRAARIFKNPVVESNDERKEYGEVRIRALGHDEEEYFVVVYTWRGAKRRLISAWKVGEDGKRRYRAILTR